MLNSNIIAVEEEVWETLSTMVNRLVVNPRDRSDRELAEMKSEILALNERQQQRVDSLSAWLRQAPHDDEAQAQLAIEIEHLGDLHLAAKILIALSN